MFEYWQRQSDKPLFPDIEWEKPEQRALAGKLLIIGGNQSGFAAVETAYSEAKKAGAGEVRVALPRSLKKHFENQPYDIIFLDESETGGISQDSIPDLQAACDWADMTLFIGDAGRGSETSVVYEELVHSKQSQVITRDAFDLVKNSWANLLQDDKKILIITLAQLQKLSLSAYYPKVILFSMQLTNLVETLHKFTLTYRASLVVYHQGQLIVAKAGRVTSTKWDNPNLIWRGVVASKISVYAMHHPHKLLEATTSALL